MYDHDTTLDNEAISAVVNKLVSPLDMFADDELQPHVVISETELVQKTFDTVTSMLTLYHAGRTFGSVFPFSRKSASSCVPDMRLGCSEPIGTIHAALSIDDVKRLVVNALAAEAAIPSSPDIPDDELDDYTKIIASWLYCNHTALSELLTKYVHIPDVANATFFGVSYPKKKFPALRQKLARLVARDFTAVLAMAGVPETIGAGFLGRVYMIRTSEGNPVQQH